MTYLLSIKNKTNGEKRKSSRYRCFLPSEVIKSEGKNGLVKRAIIHNFSPEGLKLTINLNLNLGSKLELNVYLPEKKLLTSLSGEIVWRKYVDNRLEVGLKIKDMDNKSKEEILNWVIPQWIKSEALEKEMHQHN